MMRKLNVIYFSAAGTTERVAKCVAEGTAIEDVQFHSLNREPTNTIKIGGDELTIFAIPVYEGRVPNVVVSRLKKFKGDNTPAVLVAVYGNRAVDDAFVELFDIVSAQGFNPISAGEFIAKHSLFPRLAASRPSQDDLSLARELGAKSIGLTSTITTLLGKRPYRELASPLSKFRLITTASKCTECGACTRECPVGAINSPKLSPNKQLCIKCARCIEICPKKARKFTGLAYWLTSKLIVAMYSSHKDSKLYLK